MVDDFMDPMMLGRKPVVDCPQVLNHRTGDAGFFRNFTYGSFCRGFFTLEVAFGESPLESTCPVAARNNWGVQRLPACIDGKATGGGFIHDGKFRITLGRARYWRQHCAPPDWRRFGDGSLTCGSRSRGHACHLIYLIWQA